MPACWGGIRAATPAFGSSPCQWAGRRAAPSRLHALCASPMMGRRTLSAATRRYREGTSPRPSYTSLVDPAGKPGYTRARRNSA